MMEFKKKGVWLKGNLHCHTKRSDGALTVSEAASLYKSCGYDFLAVTDHWEFYPNDEIDGVKIFSGAEIDVVSGSPVETHHILGIGMREKWDIAFDKHQPVENIINGIKEKGGLVFWAHPHWSLNSPEQIASFPQVSGLEIYNTECSGTYRDRDGHGYYDRGYSGNIADMALSRNGSLTLIATDDMHVPGINPCQSYIMVRADENTHEAILRAVEEGNFYASRGPELYDVSFDGKTVSVDCSPVCKAAFMSNACWSPERMVYGDGLTHIEYPVIRGETFVRFEAYDKDGLGVFSQPILIDGGEKNV